MMKAENIMEFDALMETLKKNKDSNQDIQTESEFPFVENLF